MADGTNAGAGAAVEGREDPVPPIAACRSCPGRLVFIEADNPDGWIATDASVEPLP